MISHVLPVIVAAMAGVLAFVAVRRDRALECLPSVFWTLSAVLPFIYLRQFFPAQVAAEQAFGIVIFSLAILSGDAATVARARPTGGSPPRDHRPDPLTIAVLAALTIFIVVLPTIHLTLQERIPLLTRLFSTQVTPGQLSSEREHFSKLLDVSAALKIMFNWVLVVAAPILFVSVVALRRYLLAALVIVWSAIYALLSLAAFPLAMLLFCCVIGIASLQTSRRQSVFLGLLILIGVLWIAIGVVRGNTYVDWYRALDKATIPEASRERLKADDLPLTPGDIDRIQETQTALMAPSTFGKHVDSLARRSVLVPMEVSDRWYAFFPSIPGGYRPLSDLLPWRRGSDWVHPAHAVAQWGYRRLFPNRYTSSTMAYASIDADAYARGGLAIVALVGVLYALFRFCFGLLPRADTVARAVYYCGLGALTIFPFQASLQAILISQGVLLYFLALAALALIRAAGPRVRSKA